MSKMSDKPEISNAEFEVLDVLWDDHPATSNEVIARL
ncbi:CopY family transcriptional repressor, partial [Pseudomonas sp. HMWF031]